MVLLHVVLFSESFKKLLILIGLILVIVDMPDGLGPLGMAAIDLQNEFEGRQEREEVILLCLLRRVDIGLNVFWEVEAGEVREVLVVDVAAQDFIIWVDCEEGTIDDSPGPGGKAEEQTAVDENAQAMRQFVVYLSLVSGISEIDDS